MALFRKFFYRKPPDGLLEIAERVYVFDCCFTTDVVEDDNYKSYIGGIVGQLRAHSPDASFMVFNFREGDKESQIAGILSEYDMTVIDYPRQYEGCPLLPIEMMQHCLRSGDSWLLLGQRNVLLMHCERGGWPILAFMLASLLLYRNIYNGEQKTLDMIYRQAPRELIQLMSPLNPLPSQLRYLQYVSRRNLSSEWPPPDRGLMLDCLIIRLIPNIDGEGGCRPVIRIYGQDPLHDSDRKTKVLFSTPKRSRIVRHYKQAESELVKLDIHCHLRGDVVLECISLDDDLEREQMMFRVMFSTAFIRSNILMLNRDEIDTMWNAKDQFPRDFRIEVLFSEMDSEASGVAIDVPVIEEKDGLPVEAFAKVQEIFSNVDWADSQSDVALNVLQKITASTVLKENLENENNSPETAKHSNLLGFKKDRSEESLSNLFLEAARLTAECGDLAVSSPHQFSKGNSAVLENIMAAGSMFLEKQSRLSRGSSPDGNMMHKRTGSGDLLPSHAQSKIISPRMLHSGRYSSGFYNNSLQGSPEPIQRFNSSPSSLGITALLHDHDAYRSHLGESPPQPSDASDSPLSDLPKLKRNALSSSALHSLSPLPPAAPSPPPPPPPSSLQLSTSDSQHHSVDNLETPSSGNSRLKSSVPCTPPLSKSPSLQSRKITSTPPPPPPPPPSFGLSSAINTSPPSISEKSTLSVPPPPPPPSLSTKTTLSVPPPPPPPPSFERPLSHTQNSQSVTPPPPPPPPLRFKQSPSLNDQSSLPMPPPPPPLPPRLSENITPDSSPTLPLSALGTSGVVKKIPPPPPPPPKSSLSTSSLNISSSVPPPPPPPNGLSSSVPPPPSAPNRLSSSAPPPPPPPNGLSSSVPPPPPPPNGLSTSVPPPPPPNGLSGSTTSTKAPPVPPPPAPLGKGLPKANSSAQSQVSGSGPVPPPPGPPGAKGRIPTRLAPRTQAQTKKANLKPYHWLKLTRVMQGSLWAEAQKSDEALKAPEFDMSELENLFAASVPKSDNGGPGGKSSRRASGPKPDKVQLVELRRAYNCEIMLSKVKIPLPDLMSAVLTLDDSTLDVDQVENLIKFCPTKEEMDLLKGYKGDKENLGKCEQFFLELMKVPRVESKLRVFSFKMQFKSQVCDLRKNLQIVNSTSEETRKSAKLKRVMQTILSLGNALNQGTARGAAVGFRLDSLLKLTDTRARNNKMTLMHYLCKVLAEKLPELLDFPKDLVSLEASTKIQLKFLAEEMQAVSKGLEKVVQELTASGNDGPVSETFCKTLKEFLGYAEGEVRSLASLYSIVGRNADALAMYFGEDPAKCPFEQVVSTLLNFVRMFIRAHDENCKQLEFEKKKAEKEAENEKLKLSPRTKDSGHHVQDDAFPQLSQSMLRHTAPKEGRKVLDQC